MANKSRKGTDGPHIYWRNGRAYADLRAYSDVGGDRRALAETGKRWGTNDPALALALFEAALADLKLKRQDKVGLPRQQTTTLAQLAQHHLVMKAKAGRTSDSHMCDLEARLREAVRFFGAGRDPRTIVADQVRAWADELSDGGRRKPGTVRHYLNALSGLYRRAQEGQYVAPSYNPVAALVEKPSGQTKGEATFFEVADAALLLEAARVLDDREAKGVGEAGNRATAVGGLYPLVATLLLTGGRWTEVRGLDVEDVSFDRSLIRFRPNAHRRLKTSTSVRTVPLWPQLREALQAWMFDRPTPMTSGLLFPSPTGGMVGDIRKSLEAMASLAGMPPAEVRTRACRHTYCSTRLQTVQRILKPGMDPADPHSWDWIEVSRFQVQKEMGHGGAKLVDRIYGHAQRPYRAETVEYRVDAHREELGARLMALRAVT